MCYKTRTYRYAQKNLVEGEGMSKEKLQETMALLAFKPNTECTKYKVLITLLVLACYQHHLYPNTCNV